MTHFFETSKDKKGVLTFKERADSIATEQDLRRYRRGRQKKSDTLPPSVEERLQKLEQASPPIIPPAGIADIKQVELYTKYRPLLPPEYQDIMCPKPSNEVMAKVKDEKNSKRTMK